MSDLQLIDTLFLVCDYRDMDCDYTLEARDSM